MRFFKSKHSALNTPKPAFGSGVNLLVSKPNSGSTSYLINEIYEAAVRGENVLVAHSEMGVEMFVRRLYKLAGIEYKASGNEYSRCVDGTDIPAFKGMILVKNQAVMDSHQLTQYLDMNAKNFSVIVFDHPLPSPQENETFYDASMRMYKRFAELSEKYDAPIITSVQANREGYASGNVMYNKSVMPITTNSVVTIQEWEDSNMVLSIVVDGEDQPRECHMSMNMDTLELTENN